MCFSLNYCSTVDCYLSYLKISDVHVQILVKYEFTQDGIRNQCARKHMYLVQSCTNELHQFELVFWIIVFAILCSFDPAQGDLRPGAAPDEGGLARRLVAFQHAARGAARGARLAECRHHRRSYGMGAPRSRPAVRARGWGRRSERCVPGRDGAGRRREGQTRDRAVILCVILSDLISY